MFEKEIDVSQAENDLGQAKANYRQMFENVLHRMQRRWKKAGVRFVYIPPNKEVDHPNLVDPIYDQFYLEKGTYGKNPKTGKRRRGWTVCHRSYDCREEEGNLLHKDNYREAVDWSIKTIERFMEVLDEFMEAYAEAVKKEQEKIDEMTEQLGARFGLLPNKPEPEPLAVKCLFCNWSGLSTNEQWKQGCCPECGVEQDTEGIPDTDDDVLWGPETIP